MNTNISNLTSWLENENSIKAFEDHLKSQPDYTYNVNNVPTRLDETLELYYYLKDLILQSISNGLFEKLPTNSQVHIHNQVQAIIQHRNNVNQFITQVQALYYHTLINGIETKLDNFDNYKRALTEIANLRRSYTRTINGLDEINKKVKLIEKNYDKSIELINSFLSKKEEIELNLDNAERDLVKSQNIFKEIEKSRQEITNSKKEILAFQANIDSYKKDISESTNESNSIIQKFNEQKDIVDKLISDSEKALQLKSSEGLSAALSSQYETENDLKKRKYWLISAGIFIFLALLGVILLVFDIEFEHFKIVNNGVNSVVARVVFVGITITGATFCANQYTKQKHIADDYGYKLVLAKSIVAFAQEIKKHNPTQAAEYMKEVLSEINKSPVSKIKEDGITKKDIGLFQKIADTIIRK